MNIRAISTAVLLLAAIVAHPPLAAAQSAAPLAGGAINSGPGREVIIPQPAGFAETALAACAGGAMIGYLAVVATGGSAALGTASLFCGLSVAATAASTVTVYAWQKVTSAVYR